MAGVVMIWLEQQRKQNSCIERQIVNNPNNVIGNVFYFLF